MMKHGHKTIHVIINYTNKNLKCLLNMSNLTYVYLIIHIVLQTQQVGCIDNTGEPPPVGPEQDPLPKHRQPRRAPPRHRLHHQAQP